MGARVTWDGNGGGNGNGKGSGHEGRSLRVALIGGPQYDHVQQLIGQFEQLHGIRVKVAFRGPHPELNRCLAHDFAMGVPYDLVSTHSKYAPSQAAHLLPLDDLVSAAGFRAPMLDLCRFRDRLLCIPRNTDVRLLWVREDLLDGAPAPTDWDELLTTASTVAARGDGTAGYAFPGRDSGLFGTFFELVAANGGELFGASLEPEFHSDECEAALAWLVRAHRELRVTPADLTDWYFDEVSAGYRSGRVAMVGDWPAYYHLLQDSPVASVAAVHPYPRGTVRRSVYAGCHAWAIPKSCRDVPAAAALLAHLTSADAARYEAGYGLVPARADADVPQETPLDRRRAALLTETIEQDMLVFPSLATYPAIEEAAAGTLRDVLRGRLSPAQALPRMQEAVELAVVAAEAVALR